MARVSGDSVQSWRKDNDERRAKFGGGDDKPLFVEEAASFPAVLVALHHTRSASKLRWGIAFVFMRLDVSPPQFIAYEAWNDDMVHRIILGAFGWKKGYENGLPANPDDLDFDPEDGVLNEMWNIATCDDLKDKSKDRKGLWLTSVSDKDKRSPYVTIKTEIETYNDKDRAKIKYVNPQREVGTDGPYFVGEFRATYQSAAKDGGPIKPAKAWYQGWYAHKVREATEAAKKYSSGKGGGGGRDSFESNDDDSIPF